MTRPRPNHAQLSLRSSNATVPGELIDHLLVSKTLLDLVGDVRSVIDPDTESAHLASITDRPSQRRNEPGSDHAPVVATFHTP